MRPYNRYSSAGSGTDALPLDTPVRPYSGYRPPTPEEIRILFGGICEYPPRSGKILRKFDLLLAKFHFILPKFHFPAPWGKFVCSVEIDDFLGRDSNCLGKVGGI